MDPCTVFMFWIASCFICWGMGFHSAMKMVESDYGNGHGKNPTS